MTDEQFEDRLSMVAAAFAEVIATEASHLIDFRQSVLGPALGGIFAGNPGINPQEAAQKAIKASEIVFEYLYK